MDPNWLYSMLSEAQEDERQIIIASLIYFQYSMSNDELPFQLEYCYYYEGLLQVLSFEFRKIRISEFFNFHQFCWQ